MTLKLIDLFAGAGGMTLGFTHRKFCGGFEPVLSIDNDQAAVDTHASNFTGRAVCDDIELWLKNNKVPKADVVIGGPPCQGFSLLNKQRVGDDRRALWEPFLDVVERSNARVFVMENVAELIASDEFAAIRRRARKMGFEIAAEVLNTADYGVPQTRRRTIALGWKTANAPTFPPTPTHANPGAGKSLPRWRTVRDTIFDLPAKPVGIEVGTKPTLNLHFGRSPTPTSLKRYAAVPPGGNRFDLQRNAPEITPQCWIKKTSGGTDLFGRLWWDRPSVTIRTEFFKPEKGRYLHPEAHRPITHREAARLMGFPDAFHFCGTKVEIARQIGNAVPPPFAGEIAKVVRAILTPGKARSKSGMKRGAKVAAN
jgi:DNA (cytosine-5)-methyltransferase 1